MHDIDELEVLERGIPYYLETLPTILDGLGLPMIDTLSVWELALPIVNSELAQRTVGGKVPHVWLGIGLKGVS